MKNKMILTTILLLSCAITGLYAAAPGGAGGAAVYKPSEDAASNLEDMWLLHSLMPDALAQQLAKDWLKAGRNPAPSIEEVAQHFGGEGGLFTTAILEKVRRNLILSGPVKFIELPLSKAYEGDYGSFRGTLIAYLNDELVKIGTNHKISLNLSHRNLGALVRNNPDQFVDLMHAVYDTIDHNQCILTNLDLSVNDFTTLPEGVFDQFDSLRALSLNGNQLTTLPAGIFGGLTNLRFLWLNRNQLTTLPSGIFAGLTNLQALWLNENQLATLPHGIFAGLINLQILSLNGNQLAIVPPDIFAGLINLQILLLNSNQLVTLPPGIFAGLTRLQNLWLHGNQLSPGVREAIRRELPATTKIEF